MPFRRRKSMIDTVKAFVEAVNARDLERLRALMADDIKLLDTAGDELSGKDHCFSFFIRLFEVAPDFSLRVETCSTSGDSVLMRGYSSSSVPRFSDRMQFRARVVKGVIHEWQSYSARPARNIDHLMSAPAEGQRPAA